MDLHLLPRVDDERACADMAELVRVAGYSTVGLTLPTGLMPEKVARIRRFFRDAGIDTAMRVDLAPTSRNELLRFLRRFRNLYDVVSVKCMNQHVSIVACRDRRVDLVFFDPANRKVRFSNSLANLLRGALEFNIAATLQANESETLSRMSRDAAIAEQEKVPVVLSSGSTSAFMVRAPSQLAALGSLIGLSTERSYRSVSEVPWMIVSKNADRKSKEYVEEGVRVATPSAR